MRRTHEGHADEPRSMRVWLGRYLDTLRVRNYSSRTVENTESSVGLFLRWCEERTLVGPEEVTRPILERYQRFLFHYRKATGGPCRFGRRGCGWCLCGYFRWLRART